MKEVTDPNILSQLESKDSKSEIVDKNILSQLNKGPTLNPFLRGISGFLEGGAKSVQNIENAPVDAINWIINKAGSKYQLPKLATAKTQFLSPENEDTSATNIGKFIGNLYGSAPAYAIPGMPLEGIAGTALRSAIGSAISAPSGDRQKAGLIGGVAGPAGELAGKGISTAYSGIKNIASPKISDYAKTVIDNVLSPESDFFGKLKDTFGRKYSLAPLKNEFSNLSKNVKNQEISSGSGMLNEQYWKDAINNIKDSITPSLKQEISPSLKKILSGNAPKSPSDAIKIYREINSGSASLRNKLTPLKDAISKSFEDLSGSNNEWKWLSPTFNDLNKRYQREIIFSKAFGRSGINNLLNASKIGDQYLEKNSNILNDSEKNLVTTLKQLKNIKPISKDIDSGKILDILSSHPFVSGAALAALLGGAGGNIEHAGLGFVAGSVLPKLIKDIPYKIISSKAKQLSGQELSEFINNYARQSLSDNAKNALAISILPNAPSNVSSNVYNNRNKYK